MKQETEEPKKETSTSLDMIELEVVLRRFAAHKNDQPLMKLLNSIFTETAEEKIAHENSSSDSSEDLKEKD